MVCSSSMILILMSFTYSKLIFKMNFQFSVLVSLFNGTYINLHRLFNAKAILVKGQWWFCLVHTWEEWGSSYLSQGYLSKSEYNSMTRIQIRLLWCHSLAHWSLEKLYCWHAKFNLKPFLSPLKWYNTSGQNIV